MIESRVEAEVLGRLLLVHQTLDALPDAESIAGFLGSALQTVPGVARTFLCLQRHLYPDEQDHHPRCTVCATEHSNAHSALAEGWLPDSSMYRLPLRTVHGEYGCLLISVEDRAAFELYSAFLANAANQLAATFEMRDHLQRLDEGKAELEARVAQRTRDLEEKNAALEQEISQRQHLEKALAESEEKFRQICTNARDGIVISDEEGRVVFWNPAAERIFQYSAAEVLGREVHTLVTPAQQLAVVKEGMGRYLATGSGPILNTTRELQATRRDGEQFPVELSVSSMRFQGRLHAIGIVRDITERKRAERELHRANRALRVLSACNQELIHAEEESALLEAVCRMLVELGGYLMAWVGFAEDDPGKTVRPVAHAGDETGYLANANISWADNERGRGPGGTVIRTGIVQVNQSFASNPQVTPWRAEALRRGYQSSIALPLKADGKTFGALIIYASEADAFDTEEVTLLEELADDLAFGICTLRGRAERNRAEEMVARLAYFDPLTGLPNRVQFCERVQRAITETQNDQRQLAVLTLNVNRFNDIHNALGAQQADEAIKQIGARLLQVVGKENLLARVAGDVFTVLLRGADADRACRLAQIIQKAFLAPFHQAGLSLAVQVSIGAALYPDHGANPDVLLLRSNIASREARAISADYALYSGATDAESPHRLALIGELRHAIQEGQLVLHYQPKIDLRAGRVCGAEALVRWVHPEKGLIPPSEFIHLAEYSGLIKPLTYWVMDAAWQQAGRWVEKGIHIPVAVNVSPSNLRDRGFLDRVLELHRTYHVKAGLLQIEITETALMEDPPHSQKVLDRLKDLGMKIFIDDFGTGYSSLAYIATLPIHALKIDRSFITTMLEQSKVHSVVEASISLARKLRLRTVAEGVDSRAQAEELSRMGCDEIQGFFFGRPVPAEELERWEAAFTFDAYGLFARSGPASD